MEEHVKMILALAWTSFNEPLWESRQKLQAYIEKHFELKKPSNTENVAEGFNGRMPTFF